MPGGKPRNNADEQLVVEVSSLLHRASGGLEVLGVDGNPIPAFSCEKDPYSNVRVMDRRAKTIVELPEADLECPKDRDRLGDILDLVLGSSARRLRQTNPLLP